MTRLQWQQNVINNISDRVLLYRLTKRLCRIPINFGSIDSCRAVWAGRPTTFAFVPYCDIHTHGILAVDGSGGVVEGVGDDGEQTVGDLTGGRVAAEHMARVDTAARLVRRHVREITDTTHTHTHTAAVM